MSRLSTLESAGRRRNPKPNRQLDFVYATPPPRKCTLSQVIVPVTGTKRRGSSGFSTRNHDFRDGPPDQKRKPASTSQPLSLNCQVETFKTTIENDENRRPGTSERESELIGVRVPISTSTKRPQPNLSTQTSGEMHKRYPVLCAQLNSPSLVGSRTRHLPLDNSLLRSVIPTFTPSVTRFVFAANNNADPLACWTLGTKSASDPTAHSNPAPSSFSECRRSFLSAEFFRPPSWTTSFKDYEEVTFDCDQSSIPVYTNL